MPIGHFRRSRSGGWEGDVRTVTLDFRLRLKPNDDRTHPNAPAFRAMVGWSHVGDGWETRTRSRPSRPMVRVHLDDPLFVAPITMALLPDEDGETAVMVWQRPQARRRDAEPGAPEVSQMRPDAADLDSTGAFDRFAIEDRSRPRGEDDPDGFARSSPNCPTP